MGAVLVPGQRAPVLVTREMVRGMKPRSVIIDVSIDEGGCVETSRPTNHEHPVYIEEGVLHYCVPNMPGAVARTATFAFVNAAMPYIEKIANLGVENAIDADPAILRAVNTHNGQLAHLTLLPEGGDEMDWTSIYKSRVVTPEEAVRCVKSAGKLARIAVDVDCDHSGCPC